MSEDLIKRSDAIEAVKRVSENYTGKGKRDYHPHVDFIIDELKYCVPSADRPQGEWKPLDRTWGRETWYCTNCEDAVVDMPTYMGIALYKYCPNCGCRMKGADDE